MNTVRPYLMKWFVLAGLALVVAGCPNQRLVIVTSTNTLDFGEEQVQQTILVTKSNTSREMPPLVVVSGEPWIEVLDCTSRADGCVSSSAADAIPVRVRIDRSLMELGENTGVLRLDVEGAVNQFVEVRAQATIIPDFSVNNRAPLTFQPITFSDNSRVAPGYTITDWFWRFSSTQTSTQQNPAPVTYTSRGPKTVTLDITATNGERTVTREARRVDYVVVANRVGPDAEFEVSNREPLVNNPVFFTDLSVPGTADITSWEWNFGDGTISREQNPTHTYTLGGSFTVSLKVVTADGFDTEVKTDHINVAVTPPTADFTADDTNPPINQPVQFTDLSEPGTAPIDSWSWNFGDNGVSSEQNPIHVYTEPGVYSVTLTVTTVHGEDTTVKDEFIVARTVPPTADFDATPKRNLLGEPVQFTDQSDPGTSPEIESYSWEFGDGATSTDPNPAHTYSAPGNYDVTLAVTARDGQDTVTKEAFISAFEPTALDEYVRKPDDTFEYSLELSQDVEDGMFTLHVIDMTSQQWRSPNEVDRTTWEHWLQVIEPNEVRHDRALLFIDGGSNDPNDPPPTDVDANLAQLAVHTGSVIAVLEQVPNQPLVFAGETRERTEDEILAHTFAQYLDSFEAGTPDGEWPALLPMTKSAVRAMDTIQDFLGTRAENPLTIDDFVVSGASKRGWTTWLTGATDDRVVAIAPLVIDFLNFVPQLEHHFNTYGFFSEAIFDYVEAGIFFEDNGTFVNRFDTPAGAALREIVDPYEYRDRFTNVPKLLVNSTGDQFFVPDSAQFYFDDLPGEKKLAYLPNTNHGLGDGSQVAATLGPWYSAILNDEPLPQFSWEMGNEGRRITVTPDDQAANAQMFLASSFNRDFRFDETLNQFMPPMWEPLGLSLNANDQYVGQVRDLNNRWNGFMVQLAFPNPSEAPGALGPFVFTTEVQISPDTFPMQNFTLPSAEFTVAPTTSPNPGQPVTFTDNSSPGSGPIIRWFWDLGNGDTSRDPVAVTSYPPGTYTVSLTVTTVHGTDTETKANVITVSP